MPIASIESPICATPPPKTNTLEIKNDKNTSTDASEFGQVMSGVMGQKPESASGLAGQDVATLGPVQAGFGATLDKDFLKAVHLGPHLNVITVQTATPDDQSLEAFARSQGLDETAVQWLMGTSPGLTPPSPVSLSDASGASGSTPSSDLTLSFLGLSGKGASGTPSDTLSSLTPSGTVDARSLTEKINTLDPLFNIPAAETAASLAGDPMKTGAAITSGALIPNVALNTAAMWAMAQPTEHARIITPAITPANDELSDVSKVQIQLMASPAPAAVWMMRNNQHIAAPNKSAMTTSAQIAESELDLTEVASPDLMESLSQPLVEAGSSSQNGHPLPLSGHSGHASGHRLDLSTTARQEALNANASGDAPDTGLAQRSENVQNLAEKMGQAVGQRILSEIEKGQWHLKLSLRPATLGHIEVEMRMRSGELDAVFTTSQAITRELLQDGMSKLKDTLNQMGTDVASLHVGDGQTRQRGGESTPEQMSKLTKNDSDDQNPSLTVAQAPAPIMKMGQDGWDVMV